MTFPLCSETCLHRYREAEQVGKLDRFTSRIEPRAALFQEDSASGGGLSRAYLALGLYVLAGLLCGGIASHRAVRHGMTGVNAFALGFLLNVVGLVIVRSRTGEAPRFPSTGLSKIPATHDEVLCPSCGKGNHPSAGACIACGADRDPGVHSEVDRLRASVGQEGGA